MAGAGKNQVIKFANVAATLVDISQYLNDASMPQEAEQLEVTAFGAQEKQYLPGFRSGTLDFGGMWEAAIHDIIAPAVGASGIAVQRAFEYYPQGTDTGEIRYSGTAVILSYEVSGSVSDITSFTASGRTTGATTRAVV
jgi:hypothetical protein